MDRALVKPRVLQDTLDRRDRLLEQVDAQLLKLRTRDRRVEVDAVVQLVDLDRRVRARRQVPLRALARSAQTPDSARSRRCPSCTSA